jgi:hypothetical protein
MTAGYGRAFFTDKCWDLSKFYSKHRHLSRSVIRESSILALNRIDIETQSQQNEQPNVGYDAKFRHF